MIIITGITKGIGRAIAEVFAAAGHHLAGCARNKQELAVLQQELETKYKIKCYFSSADLSQPQDLDNFISFLAQIPQKPIALINNAALFQFSSLIDEDESLLHTMLHTNFFSAYQLSKAVIPQFIAQQKGHIFNICSSVIYQPRKDMGSYGISKFALYGMTKILREELKPHHVKVTAVIPGSTFSNSWIDTQIDENRLIDAMDIAKAILTVFQQSPRTVTEEILIRPQEGDFVQ
jgi:short-subunit dehydrogenase